VRPARKQADEELEAVYGPLDQPIVVYGHIHRSFVRNIRHSQIQKMLIVNTGSVNLSYDGDARAAYLLMDGSNPTIRRVEYDVEKELKTLSDCGLPHSDWVAKILRTKSPPLP
jgi:predicted phosphodiesterase